MAILDQSRLSIVLSTHTTHFNAVAFKGDFNSNIAKIAGWGYDGVELAIRDPDLIDVDEVQAMLAKYGLNVPAIGTGQAWSEEGLSFTNPDQAIRQQAVKRIKNHIQLAQRFNAMVIIGLIRGVTSAGQSKLQSMDFLLECISECMGAATDDGIRLAIEPLNRYETDLIPTVEAGLELIQRIGSPNLGLLLDTFHMNIEEPDMEESLRKAGEHLFHFHVADSNRRHPGAGHLDFTAILRALQSTGYHRWISGEFMPMPDPDTAAQRGIVYLRQVLESA